MKKIEINDLEVEVDGLAQLDIRIGDYQPGSHLWIDGIKPDNYPPPDKSVWKTKLRNADNNYIQFTSATINRNPDTNWVSVDIRVNDQTIKDERLQYEAVENELVEFHIRINFK